MLLLERIVNIKLIVSAAILMTSVMAPMSRSFCYTGNRSGATRYDL